jgi:hypothetical protein
MENRRVKAKFEAQSVWRTFDSFREHCEAIAKALNQHDTSYKSSAEIGGGGSVYVNAELDANHWMYWGTVNENWGCDVLEIESGEPLALYIETDVSTQEADAQKVADAIHAAIVEFKRRQG